MVEWLMYNVVLPLLPIPLVIVIASLVKRDGSFFTIIRDGQLCFYSTTLCSLAIRDIIKSPSGSEIPFFVGGILFCFLVSAFTYGVMVLNTIRGWGNSQEDRKLGLMSLFSSAATTLLIAHTRWILKLL